MADVGAAGHQRILGARSVRWGKLVEVESNGIDLDTCSFQFEKAKEDLAADPLKLPAWVPILQHMGPSLLVECDNAIALSKQLVREWLASYMFVGDINATEKATLISEWLGNHNNFGAHARMVSIDDLIAHETRVMDLRLPEHSELRDQIWRIWSAYTITFSTTGTFKIFETGTGPRFIQSG